MARADLGPVEQDAAGHPGAAQRQGGAHVIEGRGSEAFHDGAPQVEVSLDACRVGFDARHLAARDHERLC
jgi:hypothetical protein